MASSTSTTPSLTSSSPSSPPTSPLSSAETLKTAVYDRLSTVMDPELPVDIVSLGLIYDVDVRAIQTPEGLREKIHILMTLTTPGCPLAGVFDSMVKSSLEGLPGIDPDRDVTVELTFDPPWIPDMMSEEARAELDL
jgi:metal-sulfur cluster biosynthetic enzyme